MESYDRFRRRPIALLPIFHFGLVVPLAAGGVVFAWNRRRDAWLLLWLAGVYTAAVILFLAFARFRFPLVPLLMPFAGYAIACIGRCGREREWGRAALPICAALVVGVMVNITVIDARATRVASYTNLAGIMLNQRQQEAALPFLEKASELDAHNPEVNFHYAVYYFRKGEMMAAEYHLRGMLRSAKKDVRGHRLMAAVLKRRGRHAEAARYHKRALQLDPDRGARHAPKKNRPEVVPLEAADEG
jgi:tetratricopeptide (TPR) repeat protein